MKRAWVLVSGLTSHLTIFESYDSKENRLHCTGGKQAIHPNQNTGTDEPAIAFPPMPMPGKRVTSPSFKISGMTPPRIPTFHHSWIWQSTSCAIQGQYQMKKFKNRVFGQTFHLGGVFIAVNYSCVLPQFPSKSSTNDLTLYTDKSPCW